MTFSGRIFLKLLFGVTFTLVVPNSHHQPQASVSSQRPHIIIILADDLGYNDVSFHGSDQIPTPNIDFLAYNGIILNNYYVSPICSPTRGALMTGRHPIHTATQHAVIAGGEPWGLPLNETMMPQYLKKLGYHTHIVGKWHLGMYKWDYTPIYRGFDSHFGYYQGCEDYYTHVCQAVGNEWGVDFWRDHEVQWNYTGQYSTWLFRDEALSIIEKHDKREPMFLYLPFQAVHNANYNGQHLQAPKEYIEKFNYIKNKSRRIFAGMLSALDDAVGNIYDALVKHGMLNNSVILFSTDNGGPANGYDTNAANNYPLRGVKQTLWEGGVRGVGFLHSPLLKHQGYVSNKLLHVCDWLPTLVSAANGSHLLDNATSLDGVDAWAMLSEDGDAVRTELLHNIDPLIDNAAIRVGDYKLLVGNVNMAWGGWYPPYQLANDDNDLHYLKFHEHSGVTEDVKVSLSHGLRAKLMSQYRLQWPRSVWKRMEKLYTFAEKSSFYTGPYASKAFVSSLFTDNNRMKQSIPIYVNESKQSSLDFKSERSYKLDSSLGYKSFWEPTKVDCGPKPANASTNCQPTKSPCLFHVVSDPCEYNDIAAWNTDIVTKMMDRLSKYMSGMVRPGKTPVDPAGNPLFHQGAWVPWEK